MSSKKLMVVVWFVIGIIGCGGPRAFLSPDADLGFYQRVGVAQFQSLTEDILAGQKVQRVFVTELLKRKTFDVVAQGQMARVEAQARTELGLAADAALDSAAVRLIGQRAGIQGIIVGAVRDYRLERVGQEEFPLVSFSLQLVDVATGRIVWDISLGERGGPKFPVFSFGETHTLTELATKLCRRALRTL